MNRLCIALCLLCLALPGCILYAPVDLGSLGGPGDLEETLVLGESGPKIALIELSGVITDQESRGSIGFGSAPNPVSELRSALDRADEEDVAGVLLRINSPGGAVSASETVYHELSRWKKKAGKPVIAYFNGLATSGGYYAAMAADSVIAHPTAITGSIGVIMPGVNVAGLMERFGVEDQTFTSGPFKDSGSITRPMRSDEREQLSEVIDDLYERFVEVVDAGRPGLSQEQVRALADGRVYTARQALANGLIDQIGYLEDAVEAMEQRAKLSESRLVIYHRANRSKDNIHSRLGSAPISVNVELWPWRNESLAPGFYYVWPLALRP